MLRNILFIAKKDFVYSLKEKTLLIWLFVMPIVFFGFIGSTTSGFSGNSTQKTNIAVWEAFPGQTEESPIAKQIVYRLQQENLNTIVFNEKNDAEERKYHFENYTRKLWLPKNLQIDFDSGKQIQIQYKSTAGGLTQDRDSFFIEKAVYQTIGDFLVFKKLNPDAEETNFDEVNNLPKNLELQVTSAGEKLDIPSGFNQAVPGILVMFIMMIALSSGAQSLFLERQSGVLKRMAASPLTRKEIIMGKWLGKWFITLLQMIYGMLIGWLIFKIYWGNHIVSIILILLLWAAFNSALAVLLGSFAKSEGQVSAIATIFSLLMAALGGCWWPIEITPEWMQSLASVLPTGWVMDSMHELMYFGGQISEILPQILALAVLSVIAFFSAVKRFRFF